MAPNGRVLAVENVISPGNSPHWGKLLDINMLVLTSGRERTAAEFRALFARAGLKVRRAIPTSCPLSIVDATAAK